MSVSGGHSRRHDAPILATDLCTSRSTQTNTQTHEYFSIDRCKQADRWSKRRLAWPDSKHDDGAHARNEHPLSAPQDAGEVYTGICAACQAAPRWRSGRQCSGGDYLSGDTFSRSVGTAPATLSDDASSGVGLSSRLFPILYVSDGS